MTVHTWLPALHGNSDVIQGQSDDTQAFIDAWLARLGARAQLMQPDARLMRCAQAHADYLVSRTGESQQVSMHIGAGGSTPNQRVVAAGYRLPDWYKPERNNVEACAVHHDGPREALQLLIDSPAHRPLVLGEKVSDWFWHLHTVFGVGNMGPFYVYVAAPQESML